jgi:CheY-like chemotaxis protein
MKKNSGVLFSGDAPGRHAAPASDGGRATGHWRSLRIVVADDEKDTVNTFAAILEDEGHKVRRVYSGPDVMAAVRGFEPDAVILDIAMPELSGYDVAKQIRSWFVTYRPLLIAISGTYVKGTDALLSKAVGFDHHLTKPCVIDDLLNLLAPLTSSTGRR